MGELFPRLAKSACIYPVSTACEAPTQRLRTRWEITHLSHKTDIRGEKDGRQANTNKSQTDRESCQDRKEQGAVTESVGTEESARAGGVQPETAHA